MLPKKGGKVKVNDLPSYKDSAKPELPVIVEVKDVTDWPMVVVEIDGNSYELYEDDGYELIDS